MHAISPSGRFITFSSLASNLVASDTNGMADIFIRDRLMNTTERVSVSTTGTQSNGSPGVSSVSGDGRYVAFRSNASNLVVGDTNGSADAFLHDRQTGATIRVNISSAGAQAIFPAGGDAARDVVINRNGTHVMFVSEATNLVPNDTNLVADLFLYRISDGQISRVSTATNGTQGNGSSGNYGFLIFGGRHSDISADGTKIVFLSGASNFYAGDTNQSADLFLKDTSSGMLTLLERQSSGLPLPNPDAQNPRISADGQWVTFRSEANNMVPGDNDDRTDVFIRQLPNGPTTMVNRNYFGDFAQSLTGSGGSGGLLEPPSISGAGRFVSFLWSARDIIPGTPEEQPRIFIRDVQSNRSYLVAQRNSSDTGAFARNAVLTDDGSGIAFNASAAYLAVGDTNGEEDVFFAPQLDRELLVFNDGFDLPLIPGQISLRFATDRYAAGSTVSFNWSTTYVSRTGTPCRPFSGPTGWMATANQPHLGPTTFVAPAAAATYSFVFSCTDVNGGVVTAGQDILIF